MCSKTRKAGYERDVQQPVLEILGIINRETPRSVTDKNYDSKYPWFWCLRHRRISEHVLGASIMVILFDVHINEYGQRESDVVDLVWDLDFRCRNGETTPPSLKRVRVWASDRVTTCFEETKTKRGIQVLINKAQLYLSQCLGPDKNSMASACNRAIPTERHPSLGEDSAKKFIWDRNMVYALIEEYKKRVSEFENPSYKKRRLWSKIAHAMRVRGFKMLTDEMCDIKWRNLKKTFKEIYFGKRSTVKWEYYNVLKHIFEKDMSYSNFGAVHRRPLLAKKTLNKKTLAEAMEVEPHSYIIDDSQEGLEEGEISANETQTVIQIFRQGLLQGKVSDKKNFLGTSTLKLECMYTGKRETGTNLKIEMKERKWWGKLQAQCYSILGATNIVCFRECELTLQRCASPTLDPVSFRPNVTT
uniref:Myb/SANT-like DNA-binding domain-containing protein n=1 Tax=Timema bartmani TaxID=61472 RepID=A0A7R9EP70_9NEOP|nr:unnamed protein product [Timema bartmani]